MIHIDIINESTAISDTEVRKICAALQKQVTGDFAPIWGAGTGAKLRFVSKSSKPDPNAWQGIVLDNSDQAGALGYHDLTANGLPLFKAFAGDDVRDGVSVSVTMSHETLEMLADPWLTTAYQDPHGLFWAGEVCDAVEADQLGYDIGGVLVSDFITPAWFGIPGDPISDFKGRLTAPFQIAPGGYSQHWDPHKGWVGAETPPGSRRERRARGVANWKRSER